jgi:hypothetical protein
MPRLDPVTSAVLPSSDFIPMNSPQSGMPPKCLPRLICIAAPARARAMAIAGAVTSKISSP